MNYMYGLQKQTTSCCYGNCSDAVVVSSCVWGSVKVAGSGLEIEVLTPACSGSCAERWPSANDIVV